MEQYKKLIFFSIIMIALGVTFSTALKVNSSLGTVFIAVGGLFFIFGMSKKKKHDEASSEDSK